MFLSMCWAWQVVFGVWWLRCDPHFPLAPAEGRISLQRLPAVQQIGLPATTTYKGDFLPSKPSVLVRG